MPDASTEWVVLETDIPRHDEDDACDILTGLGSLGMELRDVDAATLKMIAYFPPDTDIAGVLDTFRRELARRHPGIDIHAVTATLPDQDWVSRSRDSFRPIPAGDHFLFHPSWDQPADPGNRICIQIDPQQAFGTGSHPTTRLCVRLMETLFRCRHRNILDAGCGSGILLIALDRWIRHQCGADAPPFRRVGVEIDEDSVIVARENLAAHGVTDTEIHLSPLESFTSDTPFDFIFANMLSGILLRNLDTLHALLAPGGVLILTGILISEADEFRTALLTRPWRISGEHEDGEWCAFVVVNEAPATA